MFDNKNKTRTCLSNTNVCLNVLNQLHVQVSVNDRATIRLYVGIRENYTTVVTEYLSGELTLITVKNTVIFYFCRAVRRNIFLQ